MATPKKRNNRINNTSLMSEVFDEVPPSRAASEIANGADWLVP